jgi:cation:H+ antiporter
VNPVTLALLAGGFVTLVVGGELLVRGASRLASGLGISPLVVGLTVVAFGTSAPELAVGVTSALSGQPDIALGNVVGSNIANVLLVLGLAALVTPLITGIRVVRREVPVMIAASFVFWLMALNGEINRVEGVVLVVAIVAYTLAVALASRSEARAAREEYAQVYGAGMSPAALVIARNLGLTVIGLVGLVVGAGWIVDGATAVATSLGVPEIVIGLTIVAVGTSLPEITTSVVAGIRGHRDIAVGNVVGSCLFNILMVLGVTAIVSPSAVPVSDQLLAVDVPLMVAAAVACLPILFTGFAVTRSEGVLLLGFYVAYLGYLALVSTGSPTATTAGRILIDVAVPIAGVLLALIAVREWRRTRATRAGDMPSV